MPYIYYLLNGGETYTVRHTPGAFYNEDSYTISAKKMVSGNITTGSDTDIAVESNEFVFLSFQPTVSGYYDFICDNRDLENGALGIYDSSFNELDYYYVGFEDGWETFFKENETYYLVIKFSSSDTHKISARLATFLTLSLNTPLTVQFENIHHLYVSYMPSGSGNYTFEIENTSTNSYGNPDESLIAVYVYDDNYNMHTLYEHIYEGGLSSMSFSCDLQAGKTYYLVFYRTTGLSDDTTGEVKVSLNSSSSTGNISGGGGGSSSTATSVTVETSTGGTVKSDKTNPSTGDKVTLTITPDSGYELGSLTITDKNGNNLDYTDNGNGTITFTYGGNAVSISATFKKFEEVEKPSDDNTENTTSHFSDVDSNSWYYDSVNYVVSRGIMNGTSATTFAPSSNLSRAMMVQILFNYVGKPAVDGNSFNDVSTDAWYYDAVSWAFLNNVVNGYGDNTFAPDVEITREQMAVILYNFCDVMKIELPATKGATSFSDSSSVSNWAVEAVNAMYSAGILNGKSGNIFDPQGKATRAEVATMFMNFLNIIEN